jgi:hypothetical protein
MITRLKSSVSFISGCNRKPEKNPRGSLELKTSKPFTHVSSKLIKDLINTSNLLLQSFAHKTVHTSVFVQPFQKFNLVKTAI